ncbi:MAG TPA: hypothetical protein PLE30_11325 [Candidatus Kapabacteria bacterium]|nr:hypothetical protein [Candidatus Kapabacteria bacterium]
MDNTQKLPVLYFCGGYNCRHRWVAVIVGEITLDKGAKPKAHELETAEKLSKHGINVHFVKESDKEGVKMYDAITNNNVKTEFKSAKNVENEYNHLCGILKNANAKGANNLVIDITKDNYNIDNLIKNAKHICAFNLYTGIKKVIYLVKDKIYFIKIWD